MFHVEHGAVTLERRWLCMWNRGSREMTYKRSDLRTTPSQFLAISLPILFLFAAFPTVLHGMDLRAGRRVTIPAGEAISGNLYAAAGEVLISGSVAGDLVAAGG